MDIRTGFLRVSHLMLGVNAYTSQLICRLASMQLICNPIHERANRRVGWPAGRLTQEIDMTAQTPTFAICTLLHIHDFVHIYTRLAWAPADTCDLRKRAKMRRRKFIFRRAIDV